MFWGNVLIIMESFLDYNLKEIKIKIKILIENIQIN